LKELNDINLRQLIEGETGQVFNKGKICCPFHKAGNEKTPSFSIKFNSNKNKWMYKCFACDSSGDAIDFVRNFRNVSYKEARKYLGIEEKLSKEEIELQKVKKYCLWSIQNHRNGQELLGIFPFTDINNNILYYKLKFLKPDGTKDMSYCHIEDGIVKGGRGDVPEVPYNLYGISKCENKAIIILEGEKDANTINSCMGKYCVATSVKGLKDFSYFKNKRVFICGDTGKAGEKYVKTVKEKVFDIVSEYKEINLPEIELLGDNKDITDWLEELGTVENLKKIFKETMDLKLQNRVKYASYTNKGLLDYFLEIQGDNIRYVKDIGMYIIWNGKKWSMEDERAVNKMMASFLYNVVDDVTKYMKYLTYKKDEKDEIADEYKKFLNIKKNLDSLRPLRVMKDNFINVCTWISNKELDTNNTILNCDNGVLDLKTMKLVPHDKEKYCTKITNIPYNPEAKCENFLSSLDWIFPNKDTRKELQKAYGYSLSGEMDQQVLFFLWGKGENGKSTITVPLRDIMGDYYNSLDSKSLEPKKDNTAPSSDFAKLINTRFVLVSEPSLKQRLDDGKLKTLASGEDVNARFMRQNEFTYNPKFKLWIPTNALPMITNIEHGFWRRIIIFPCKNKPKKKILGYYEKFIQPDELPGILNWALQGRQLLEEEGFTPTEEMIEALEEYKSSVNPLEEFISQNCILGGDFRVLTANLLKGYNEWAEVEGFTEMKVRTFRNKLVDMGYEIKKSTKNKSTVFGVALTVNDSRELELADEEATRQGKMLFG
jgi:P4 family phage/plasmid primase-like protien